MKNKFSPFIWLGLIGVLVFSFLTRLYRLGLPADYVFDETYHVPAIRLIAEKDPRAFEWWHGPIYSLDNHDWLHPPLAKYLQAGFFNVFGQNALAWRLGSAIFGTIGVGLIFLVAQLAFRRPALSLLAAFLLSLDGLWLVQSRVAMNDVFLTVWLLAAAGSYLWYQRVRFLNWLLPVGVFLGLALATKWSAMFWVGGLLIWEGLAVRREKAPKRWPWALFALIIVPLTIYLMSYLPMLWQGKTFNDLWQLHRQIVLYQVYRGGSHSFQSTPWQWFLNLKPVWYWHGGNGQDIYAVNNPLLAWLEIAAVVFAFSRLKLAEGRNNLMKLAWLLAMYLLTFLPWLFSPRLLFYYHYTPATPLAAVLLAYSLYEWYLSRPKRTALPALLIILISLVWVFWLYYPVWIGLPVSSTFSQAIYWFLPTATN